MAHLDLKSGYNPRNPVCFFVSDLHGHIDRYEKLISRIKEERPQAVFFGRGFIPLLLDGADDRG